MRNVVIDCLKWGMVYQLPVSSGDGTAPNSLLRQPLTNASIYYYGHITQNQKLQSTKKCSRIIKMLIPTIIRYFSEKLVLTDTIRRLHMPVKTQSKQKQSVSTTELLSENTPLTSLILYIIPQIYIYYLYYLYISYLYMSAFKHFFVPMLWASSKTTTDFLLNSFETSSAILGSSRYG